MTYKKYVADSVVEIIQNDKEECGFKAIQVYSTVSPKAHEANEQGPARPEGMILLNEVQDVFSRKIKPRAFKAGSRAVT